MSKQGHQYHQSGNNHQDDDLGNITKYIKQPSLIQTLKKKGVHKLFQIQYKTFKYIEQGQDLIARDKTGSGKTLAFSLPVLQRLKRKQLLCGKNPKFLIVLPTRQLVLQVKDQLQSLRNQQLQFKCLAVYGKSDMSEQIRRIKNGTDILVATPGRLIDLLGRDAIRLDDLQVLCLDEADQMLKQGFKQQVEKIYKYVIDHSKKKTQNLLFSATIPEWLSGIAQKYMDSNYKYINLIRKDALVTPIKLRHMAIKLKYQEPSEIIQVLIEIYANKSGNVIIFCQKKSDTNNLASTLQRNGIPCEALHGDIPQYKRESAYRKYKSGQLKVLVATNVAARGLDFPQIDIVIQSQPPNNTETYVHRSGRTARKGREGICITLFNNKNERFIQNIEKQAKIQIQRLSCENILKNKKSKSNKYQNSSKPKKSQRSRSRSQQQKSSYSKQTKKTQQKNNYQLQLYIKNLPTSQSEQAIKSYFKSNKVEYKSLRLLKTADGKSKGAAFIIFTNKEDKDSCLNLDGQQFEKCRLSITCPISQY